MRMLRSNFIAKVVFLIQHSPNGGVVFGNPLCDCLQTNGPSCDCPVRFVCPNKVQE